jgi:WD40 repeat protein
MLLTKGGTVDQWDLESNSRIRSFHHHDNTLVLCLATTVDGARLLSGDAHGFVLLWDIATGQQLTSVRAHHSIEYESKYSLHGFSSVNVSCLAVTPDGRSFVSGSREGSLKLWHFDALEQPAIQFTGHDDDDESVNSCVLSADGSQLFSSHTNRHHAMLWPPQRGYGISASDCIYVHLIRQCFLRISSLTQSPHLHLLLTSPHFTSLSHSFTRATGSHRYPRLGHGLWSAASHIALSH